MSMQRKTITVTEQQDLWIKSQVDSGHYGNDSEYLREQLRQSQELEALGTFAGDELEHFRYWYWDFARDDWTTVVPRVIADKAD